MKYLPIREIDTVAEALNFSTPDLHVIGGCDVYTTKAAGTDKKLYKDIEHTLESQYESLVRFSASLSPPYRTASEDGKRSVNGTAGRTRRSRTADLPEVDLSRASPFGSLSKITARRTYAYLIATLNASHPDYDFSRILRPTDFKKQRSLRSLMHKIDTTLQNMRPKQNMAANFLAVPSSVSPSSVIGCDLWTSSKWNLIDQEMDLRNCEKYTYAPDDDPFDGEEGAIWSLHYFFFNKERKRVCYMYMRALSVISHSPVHLPVRVRRRPKPIQRKASSISIGEGAGKRASYWLGPRANDSEIDADAYDDDDDDEMIIAEPDDDDDEVDVDRDCDMDLDDIRRGLSEYYWTASQSQGKSFSHEFGADGYGTGGFDTHGPRRMSEEIGENMDL